MDEELANDSISISSPFFPEKPKEEIGKQSMNRSLLSIGLFIAASYFIFSTDLTYILILTLVILIHELGHFIAMRLFGYGDVSIFFVPLVGAFASGTKENVSQRQSVIMLLAGPMPRVFIGVILYYFGLKEESSFLIRSANIFIFLNLFNLLPVMPLDGGRIIKSLFFEANELVGKIFIIISLVLLSLYAFYAESYFILIVPFFLLVQLNSQPQSKKVQVSAEARGIDLRKSYSDLSNEEYWLIRDEVGTHMSYFKQFITPGEYRISQGEQKIIRQIKEILRSQTTQDLGLIGKILVIASILVAFFAPFVLIGIFQVLLQP